MKGYCRCSLTHLELSLLGLERGRWFRSAAKAFGPVLLDEDVLEVQARKIRVRAVTAETPPSKPILDIWLPVLCRVHSFTVHYTMHVALTDQFESVRSFSFSRWP